MFELIRANKRRSLVLVFLMLLLLLALGFAIGAATMPYVTYEAGSGRPVFMPAGGFLGMGVALVIWVVQLGAAFLAGDRIMLAISHARPIEKEDHPQLFNVVEEMTIASRLGKMPRIYVIDDMSMNAFATGRKPENASIAVTAGLLANLNRDQLQGVVAHEISHIVHRDILFMTVVGVMLGSIVLLSQVFLRGLFFSGGHSRRYRRSSSSRGGGGGAAALVLVVVAIVLAILAPILAQAIYYACSRRREYLADAGAAVYTRYPEGLAQALEILGGSTQRMRVSAANAPMFIVNPLAGKSMSLGAGRTHPSIHDRIKILRGIGNSVSYQNYQRAWRKVAGREAKSMPGSAAEVAATPVRKPHPDSTSPQQAQSPRDRMRQAGDVMRKLNQFIFLPCACGMRIKLPPEFKREQVRCPRCRRTLQVPVAQLAAAGAVGEHLAQQAAPPQQEGIPVAQPRAQAQKPLEVTKPDNGWMSFKCECGAVKQLAPSFTAPQTRCNQCGRTILVKHATQA